MRRTGVGQAAGRLLLTGLLVIYAAVALANGLDRISQRLPAVERLVPAPFRAASDRARAATALVTGQTGKAMAAAMRAVRADPVHPDSVGLLAATLLARGDEDRAQQAFRVAARFGWRNLSTQLYFYAAALAANDGEVAVDRTDAILRLQPSYPEAQQLLKGLESNASAAQALAGRVAQTPVWTGLYLNLALAAEPAVRARRAQTVAQIGAAGHPLGCITVTHLTEGLLQAGERRLAQQVWNANCPSERVAGGLTDPGFEQLDAEQRSPFGWGARRSGDVSISVEGDPKRRHVLLANRASLSRLALVQPVVLAPGRYRVTAAAQSNGGRAAGRLLAQAGCSDTLPFPSGVEGDMVAGGQIVTVPACDRQWFGIWLTPGTDQVSLDSLALKPLH